MTDFGSVIGIILAVALAAGYLGWMVYKYFKQRKLADASVAQLTQTGFSIDASFTHQDFSLYLDDTKRQFAVRSDRELKVYWYTQLLDFGVNEQSSASMSGKTGASIVGAVLFGATGAVIGASGERQQNVSVNNLTVSILVDDIKHPKYAVEFLDSSVNQGSMRYQNVTERAGELVDLLNFIKNKK